MANGYGPCGDLFGIGGDGAALEGGVVNAGAVVERLVVLPGGGSTVVWDCPGRPGAAGGAASARGHPDRRAELGGGDARVSRPFRVLAFDQRGHGRGLGWAGGYRLEDCADDVAAVAAALGIDRLIVVGYSMGGLIAQLVWRRHRQLTAGLVLCATASNMAGSGLAHSASLLTAALLAPVLMASAPDLPGWAVPGLATGGTGVLAVAPPALAVAAHGWLPTAAGLRADLLGRYLLDTGGNPARRAWALAQMRRTPLTSALAAVSAVYQFSSHTSAGDIDVPTAVIIPRRDRVVPPTRQHTLAAAVPDAVTYDLDGDHGVFLTAPDRLLTALRTTCHHVGTLAHTAADPPDRGPAPPEAHLRNPATRPEQHITPDGL